jgi:ATP-dependent helicase/nuclease subunit A
VVADTPDGEPSVSVASYISETDEDQRDRDAEETKRLLYVALTRARDVLYLATVLKDGEMKPGRGSLGEVLPDGVRALFSSSVVSNSDSISWTGPSGASHTLRVVPPAAQSDQPLTTVGSSTAPISPSAFGPLVVGRDLPRLAATEWAAVTPAERAVETPARIGHAPFASANELIVGSLVHRLFQVAGGTSDVETIERHARALIRPDERVLLENEAATLAEALALYRALESRNDVRADLASGVAHFEVPFALRVAHPEIVLRGSIDCLVERPDGSVLVLEFKTGRPKPEHQRQLETYLDAARAMFPGAVVEGRVLYPQA